MSPASVLLIDDNPVFVRIAARFLAGYQELAVIGTANNSQDALAKAQHLQPNVVLIDLALAGSSGLDAIPLLRQLLPEACIIVLTLLDNETYRQAALQAGANDLVPKATLNTDLVPAIWRALQIIPRPVSSTDTFPPPHSQ